MEHQEDGGETFGEEEEKRKGGVKEEMKCNRSELNGGERSRLRGTELTPCVASIRIKSLGRTAALPVFKVPPNKAKIIIV